MPRRREQSTSSCWTNEYSLRNSEGYAVIEGGIPIGYVALAPAAPDEQLSIPTLV